MVRLGTTGTASGLSPWQRIFRGNLKPGHPLFFDEVDRNFPQLGVQIPSHSIRDPLNIIAVIRLPI